MSVAPTSRLRVAVDGPDGTAVAGRAYVSERRGVVSTVFDYEPGYLGARFAYSLSPDLTMVDGKHSVSGLPGCFADSAPDRWGRNLIAKRVRAEGRDAGRPDATVREVDYLLGVSDVTRQGALRFAREDGPYLDVQQDVPRLMALPRLLHAADEVADDGDDMAAVKVLLDAGTGSLGGARPKASVRDGERLLIAKFPHHSDEWDVMAWEKTALDLAEQCGIRVPVRHLVDVGGRHVLLLERFDRVGQDRRGYISTMTLLGRQDGDGADYLEIAEGLSEHGSAVAGDLSELWRRIALSLMINNVDDHLRNHGLLREASGWRLSPAFDINPHPDIRVGRATTIGFVDEAEEGRSALLDSAREFGLDPEAASELWSQVAAAAAQWRDVARSNEIPESECARFAPALDRFRH